MEKYEGLESVECFESLACVLELLAWTWWLKLWDGLRFFGVKLEKCIVLVYSRIGLGVWGS